MAIQELEAVDRKSVEESLTGFRNEKRLGIAHSITICRRLSRSATGWYRVGSLLQIH